MAARVTAKARSVAGAPALWRREWFLAVAAVAAAIFGLSGEAIFARAGAGGMVAGFVVLFGVILGAALSVVRHADALAARLGEPYGTLILTLAVTTIEVLSISAVILHGDNNPTLVRDSLVGVQMIVLNGMVGLSLLIGGWRHREQHYNLQGANSYMGVIIPITVLTLVAPTFTRTTPGPTLSFAQGIFLSAMSVALYAVFLALQTGRHRAFFVDGEAPVKHGAPDGVSTRGHALLLVAYMAPVAVLAEQMALPMDYFIETLHAPVALGGLAMAVLVASPEALGAVRAAIDNNLQRSVNIFLGSVLATTGLTVPAMLIIGDLTGHSIILGVQGVDMLLLLLTLAVSVVTFSSGRTNVLQGFVHLLLFGAYLMMIVQA
jgi:Ca2+:H+ antiporter